VYTVQSSNNRGRRLSKKVKFTLFYCPATEGDGVQQYSLKTGREDDIGPLSSSRRER
jgi:hypothetical protein